MPRTSSLALPLMLALLVASAAPLAAQPDKRKGPSIDTAVWPRALARTERFMAQKPAIPDSAFGRYTIVFNAAQKMKIAMTFRGLTDERTGERLLQYKMLLAQDTGPGARLMLSEELRSRTNLLLKDGDYKRQLTSPAYTETNTVRMSYSRGHVVLNNRTQRTVGNVDKKDRDELPLRPSNPNHPARIHRSLAFVFATLIALHGPRGETHGLEMFDSESHLWRAVFKRTGKTRPIKFLDKPAECHEVEMVIQSAGTSGGAGLERFWVDRDGHVVEQVSDLGNGFNAIGKATKFEPITPDKVKVIAGAREEVDAEDWLAKGEEALGDGKILRAARRLKKAREVAPDSGKVKAFAAKLQAAIDKAYAGLDKSDSKYKKMLSDLFRAQERVDEKHANIAKMTADLGGNTDPPLPPKR